MTVWLYCCTCSVQRREVQGYGLVRRVLPVAACCLACQGCARVEWLCVYVSFSWCCMVIVSRRVLRTLVASYHLLGACSARQADV